MNGQTYFAVQPAYRPRGKLSFGGFFNSSTAGLWRSDGTSAGTQLIDNSVYLTAVGIVAAGGYVYFQGYRPDGPNAYENGLYRSDGAPGSAQLVVAFSPFDKPPAAVGERIYFTAIQSGVITLYAANPAAVPVALASYQPVKTTIGGEG